MQTNKNNNRDPGYSVQFEDILLDVSKDYNFPILKINEFGHKCPNTPLPIGGVGEMDAEAKSFKITENHSKPPIFSQK